MNLSVGDTDGLARVVDSCVQHVIIGLDNTQVFADLDLASASATDFAQGDDDGDEDDDGSDDDEESDFDDDFNDVVRMNLKPLISVVYTPERLLIYLDVCKTCRRVCFRLMRTTKTTVRRRRRTMTTYQAGPTMRP